MDVLLIRHPPGKGVWNMAVDEVLLAQSAANECAALRFYGWSEPTLSLGYFQTFASRDDHRPSKQLPIVRRASGGGAIVHDQELTYAFACPSVRRLGNSDQLYDAFHETLVETLRAASLPAELCTTPNEDQGAFLCFRRHTTGDVLINGNKVGGSAQRRKGRAILQHGSILLSTSDSAPELRGIAQLGGSLSREQLMEAWLPRLTSRLGLKMSATDLSEEQVESAKIAGARLDHAAWRKRR